MSTPRIAVALLALFPLSTACDKLGLHSAEGDGAAPPPSGGAAVAPPAATPPSGGASSLAFLGTFEGEIDGFTKNGGKQVPITALVKAGKVRADVPDGLAPGPMGGAGYAIFDPAAKRLTVVSDAKRQAVVMDLDHAGRAFSGGMPGPGGRPGAPPSGPPSKLTKTGKTDTVAGYACEYWDITSDHRTGTVCMGSDGPSWLSLPTASLPASGSWMAGVMDGKHFPLRFIGYGKDGTTEESRAELTKIDKKSVPDASFQVPPGYRTIDLDQMMGGFGGMPGMPPNMPAMPNIPNMPPMPPRH